MSESGISECLARLAPDFGVPTGSPVLPKLAVYLAELARWNTSTNLVGRLSEEDLAIHALESVFGAPLLEAADRIVDIGSGGGFPGVPLAISGFAVTLLEPRERRAAFLRHVVRTLGLEKAAVRTGRVADLDATTFSAATVRGVGDLENLIGNAGFLKPRGKLIAWTADALALEPALEPVFRLETRLPLPLSERREIVLFRKCSTWNNAADG